MICDYCKHQKEKGHINACLSCKWDDSLVDNFEPKVEINAIGDDSNIKKLGGD